MPLQQGFPGIKAKPIFLFFSSFLLFYANVRGVNLHWAHDSIRIYLSTIRMHTDSWCILINGIFSFLYHCTELLKQLDTSEFPFNWEGPLKIQFSTQLYQLHIHLCVLTDHLPSSLCLHIGLENNEFGSFSQWHHIFSSTHLKNLILTYFIIRCVS